MTADAPLPGGSRYETVRALVVARADGTTRAPPGAVSALRALCESVVVRLSVQGATVSLVSDPATASGGVAAASDAIAHARAEVQFTTGEGPGLDAVAGHRPVLVPDLAATERWPGYTSTVHDSGLRAVFSLPLHVGGVVLGVLELHADTPGSMGEERLADALTYARVGTDILLDGRILTDDGLLDSALASALDYRSEIYQAQGMLMVSLEITLTEALVRMRSTAFGSGRALIDVARDIHAGRGLEEP